jgi:hypothetical protein
LANGAGQFDWGAYQNQIDLIAEAERSRGFAPGLGLSESTLRERAGDYAGALIAAYKELAWAYSYSSEVTRASIEAGLQRVKDLYKTQSDGALDARVSEVADAVLLFNAEQYAQAGEMLGVLFSGELEPDAFSQWMILVCRLEAASSNGGGGGSSSQGGVSRADLAAYSSIRSRYELFPAYWHYGARAFSGNISADYAERCINLNPAGPYAAEARMILARFAGLDGDEGSVIMSRKEIEDTITKSVAAADPDLLQPLLPLIALRDNPFTIYASGAMRALAEREIYKTWFAGQNEIAKRNPKNSRLSDRLNYIARG